MGEPTRSERSGGHRTAHAFAPGHLTGIFAPATQARDPRARGSVGAGIVLERGVWAEARWRPGHRARVVLDSDLGRDLPISMDVARRLVGRRPGTLRLRLRHELPVGQGFGTSAAGALATGLATARAMGLPPRRGVEMAHLADLFGQGGLGGVSAILGGGWERRRSAGIPPHGRSTHRRFERPVWIALLGRPLPSPSLLGSARFLDSVRRAADAGLRRIARRPTERAFLEEAERFTDRLGLASPRLARAIHRLRRDGAWAGQAMFGRSLWAVARSEAARPRIVRTLARLGARAVELSAAPRGAWAAAGLSPSERESVLNRTRLARLP